jgi:hypothetical protein
LHCKPFPTVGVAKYCDKISNIELRNIYLLMDVISDNGSNGSVDGSDKITTVSTSNSGAPPTGINRHGKASLSNLHSRYVWV